MPRKWRPILAALLLLGFTTFAYIHSAPASLDISSPIAKFDPDSGTLAQIPANIRRLDGQPISVEGFMIPMDQADHITKFAIVPKQFNSEFGTPPEVTQVVVAASPVGVDYNPEKIRVIGKLHVRITRDEGYIVSVFDMEAEQIETVYTGPFARWPWYVVIGLPVLAMAEIVRRTIKHRRRRLAGHCQRCGYDLRATPARCPECGLQNKVTIPA